MAVVSSAGSGARARPILPEPDGASPRRLGFTYTQKMKDKTENVSASLRTEADIILYNRGLLDILREYGLPNVSGSYTLDLMTWRDLDIYLEAEAFSEERFFELGGRIATALAPSRMHFRNERVAQTQGLPLGLYWGVYFDLSDCQSWKVDIWCVESEECRRLLAHASSVLEKLTSDNRQVILTIKSECWNHPEYRRGFSSNDIYAAVLENNISTFGQFREYLKAKTGISV